MSVKEEKATQAAFHSARAKAKTHEYRSVDGRTYVTEQKTPSTTPDFHEVYKRLGHGFPSLAELYRCDHYLSGKGCCTKTQVPKRERERLMTDLALEFNRGMGRYTAPIDAVWAYFQGRYPDKLAQERITSYGELVYRSTHIR